MIYAPSSATAVFFCTIGAMAALIVLLGRKPKNRKAPRWLSSLALAGDHASAAFFVGICGAIAFYGYDGFLYAIGAMAGVMILKFISRGRTGQGESESFSEALHSRFPSSGICRVARFLALACGTFFLVPHVVATMAIARPLGIGAFGCVVLLAVLILFVVRAGSALRAARMLLLLVIIAMLALVVMRRGLNAKGETAFPRRLSGAEFRAQLKPADVILPATGAWKGRFYARVRHADGSLSVWSFVGMQRLQLDWPASMFAQCQLMTVTPAGETLINGLPQRASSDAIGANDLQPMGSVRRLANDSSTGSLAPLSFLSAVQEADIVMPRAENFDDEAGHETIYYGAVTSGQDVLAAGNDPALFPALRSGGLRDRLNFVSLMLALLCGVPAMRFNSSPRTPDEMKMDTPGATLGPLAMSAIALFYLLALYVGLGAMTSGRLDPTNSNLALPLLANSLGNVGFGLVVAVFLLAIFGSMADVIRSTGRSLIPRVTHGSHLIMVIAAVLLGLLLQKMNVAFLFAWCFNVAAATNLAALTVGLSWKRATAAGVIASMLVGFISSVLWILLSREAGFAALAPFNQPALITLPLSFVTLIVVSLLTPRERTSL